MLFKWTSACWYPGEVRYRERRFDNFHGSLLEGDLMQDYSLPIVSRCDMLHFSF
jgi:hypothetical protein